jgi:hypothetical protein
LRLRLPLALALALAGAFGGAPPAVAQPATATDPKEMARRFGEQALAAHAEGRFKEAFDGFETAERIAHSPVFVLWMARSKRGLAQLLEARALYEKVAGEELPEGASPKWAAARDEARSELESLVRRIPRLKVELERAPPDARVEIDDIPRTPGADVELDPGTHHIRAIAPARPNVERIVALAEGDKPLLVRLAFQDLAPGSGPSAPSSRDRPSTAAHERGSILPGAVLLGVGGLGLVAGGVTGAYALALAGAVEENCVGNQCLRSDESKADGAYGLAHVSTGLFIGGAALAALGVTLLVVRPGGPDAPRKAGAAKSTARLRATRLGFQVDGWF